ncbi:hypothetical protein HKX48_000705 [Thoreauomyces humboldtii]|nr:hypothetical protein HKX48_000705 [Thoreauomyces humboldtii]
MHRTTYYTRSLARLNSATLTISTSQRSTSSQPAPALFLFSTREQSTSRPKIDEAADGQTPDTSPASIERSMQDFNAKIQSKTPNKARDSDEGVNESAAGERHILGRNDPEEIAPSGNQKLREVSFKPK